jgi:hypothetical protein
MGVLDFPTDPDFQASGLIGRLTALAFAAAIDDPDRFRRSRDVGAYPLFGCRRLRIAQGSPCITLRISDAPRYSSQPVAGGDLKGPQIWCRNTSRGVSSEMRRIVCYSDILPPR